MRTAVIRINVDPTDTLSADDLRERTATFAGRAADAGIGIVDTRLDTMPARRRELQLLMTGDDSAAMQDIAVKLCAESYDTEPLPGAVTYISRGTDEDAHGVLAGFGLTGDIARTIDDEGLDVITVRLARRDLERVPESRIQTALEASLNCEVRIIAD